MYTQSKEFKTRITHKHDVQSNWLQAENKFVPLAGELIVYDADGTYTQPRYKIGNGKDLLGNLPFIDAASVIEELDYTDAPEAGKYVSAVTQSNGVIAVTKASLPAIPTVNNAKITIAPGTKLTTGGDFTTNQGTAETITLNHETTTRSNTTSSEAISHGESFNVIDTISSDTTGHVTAVNTKTVTLPKASLYYVEGSGSTTDSTAKTSTWLGSCDGITSYYPGLSIAYKLDVAGQTTTTLNINGLGAITVVRNANTGISTAYPVGTVAFLTYTVDSNGTQYWKAGDYDSNTTYTNVKLGHGYATCDTAAATTAKTATLSSYTLTAGGIVNVRFANGNTASKPTLNINSKGAKSIYYNNAALTDTNLIKAGDVVTFIYSSYYRIIAINGKYFDAQTVFGPTANAAPGYGGTFTVPSYTVTADGRVVAGADRTITMPSAQDLSNYKTKQPVVSNPTASGNATAFIDTISQDANGNITVTKKNVQFPNYDSTYKKIQTAVSSPTASGNTTAFIDTISQDAQGKITVTKKNVQFPDYSNVYQPKDNYKLVQTAVSDPIASGSASAFIDSISQDTNGKITVTKKNLSLPSVLKFIGTTTTTLTDGATTNPISIGGKSVTAVSGNVVILSGTDKEFLWTGSAWEEFGNASGHSIVGHTHTVSVSGSVSEFLGTVTKGKPTINVTVGTHPGVSVTAPTDEVLGSATTFTAASALNSNVVTGGTTKYLGIGSVALNTDTVTEVTGNTDVTATNTVLGTATSASKITSSNVTAAGKTTAGTAISVPQYTFSNVTASKLSSAGSSTNVGASKVSSWSAGTMSVSGETLTLALPSLSYSSVTASKVTLPTFTNATASKATAGTAISVPQHTHAADVTASKITANTSITVPVISSNASVTASKVTTGDVTVATSVKTQPALSAYTATATGRIKYLEGVSSSKPGITTSVTVGTNDKVNAVTSVSASTNSPTVTAALASDVVTDVAGKTKTVTLSGSAAASTN